MKKFLTLPLILVLFSCGSGSSTSTEAPSVSFTTTDSYPRITVGARVNLTWSATNSDSCEASGLWSGTKPVGGSEDVDIINVGDNKFTITCNGPGGSSTESLVWNAYRMTYGKVVDGYIRQADVFIDKDGSWTLGGNEDLGGSNNIGRFYLPYSAGNLVSIGGIDLDTEVVLDNFLMTHKLTGYSDFKVISPITSIAAFMVESSYINLALGLSSDIDIYSFDPVANKGDNGTNDYLYEKGNQLTIISYAIQNLTNNLNNVTETTQDYFEAIALIIEEEYSRTGVAVDIESYDFLEKVLDKIIAEKSLTISNNARLNILNALSALLPIIQVKAEDFITTSLIRFGLSTFQEDIQIIANGTASGELIASYTSNIFNYIADDQSINVDDIIPN